MKRWLPYLGLFVLFVMLAAGCGFQRSSEPYQTVSEAPMPAPTMLPQTADARMSPSGGDESAGTGAAYDTPVALPDGDEARPQRVVIYTGTLALVVRDAGKAADDITALATRLGGYVSAANLYVQNDVQRGSLTIRVPAEKYQETLAALRAMAVRVERETTGTEDVTQEYTDLEARKANLEHTEQALQKLLDERLKVGRTQDILEVYRELSNVRGQIEQIEGRLRYLANLAALCTITIELIPDVLYQPVTVAGWEPQGIARQALQALVSALQTLATILIWAIVFVLPVLVVFLLPLALLVLLIRWLVRRRRSRKNAT